MSPMSPNKSRMTAILGLTGVPGWSTTMAIAPHGAAIAAAATTLVFMGAAALNRNRGTTVALAVVLTWAAGVVAADLLLPFDMFTHGEQAAEIPLGSNAGAIVVGSMLWLCGIFAVAFAAAPFVDTWDWISTRSKRRAARRTAPPQQADGNQGS